MNTAQMPKLLILVGPTGAGKTSLAVSLCEALGGEIIGADSVQVYRGLDIGSAKAAPECLRSIRHHMTDIIEPDQFIDAARYAALAERVVSHVMARGAIPLLVGGTGLWIRALIRGLVQLPAVDRDLRERLEQEWQALGPGPMHAKLAAVDPGSAARIHPHDRIRVLRALEIYMQSGFAASELRATHALGTKRFDTLVIAVQVPREELDERLRARTRAMIDAGWVEEVKQLVSRYGPRVRSLHSVGYHQMLQHVLEGVPLDDTERAIVLATRQYARRQRTWFQSDSDVNLTMPPEEVLSEHTLRLIREFWER